MANEKNEKSSKNDEDILRLGDVPKKSDLWVSRLSGTVGGVVLVSFSLFIPVVNTWLANSREIQILQIKNTAEQVAYITKRMEDADKERDLYKKEMLECQQELRELRGKK
jgi:hypothetical protein